MNYKKIYDALVNKAKKLNRKKSKGVLFEKHHIVPKSLGGSNDKSNLVLLTPKEHYMCHRLLVEIYRKTSQEHKMYYAMWCMVNGLGNQKRYATSSRIYENFRTKIHFIQSKERFNNRKQVEQYTLQGKYIKTFNSPTEASMELNISRGGIESCAREESKSSGGFNWKYTDSEKVIREVKHIKAGRKPGSVSWNKGIKYLPGSQNKKYKKVEQYTKEGVFIKEYERIDLASKINNISRSSIENCCLNKSKTAGGFNWKYVNSNKLIVPIKYDKPGVKKGSIPWNKKIKTIVE
jgi:hypothetical protein